MTPLLRPRAQNAWLILVDQNVCNVLMYVNPNWFTPGISLKLQAWWAYVPAWYSCYGCHSCKGYDGRSCQPLQVLSSDLLLDSTFYHVTSFQVANVHVVCCHDLSRNAFDNMIGWFQTARSALLTTSYYSSIDWPLDFRLYKQYLVFHVAHCLAFCIIM